MAWIQTVSGATAPLGSDEVRGVEIAVDDKGGELLGHPIELTGEDSLCSAEGGQAAGTKIAADPTIVGIVGTSCSSEARAAMPLISEAGMVMISGSNTNPDLTNPDHPDHYPGYFRTAHNDLFQGRVAAEFTFNELGIKTAATIHDGSPYAESLQQVFADVFTELGGTITSQEAVNVGDTDMKGVLTKIGADKPGLIYFPIFEPESDFIAAQKCDVPDLADTIMMSADGSLSDTFPEASGECAINMFLSGPFVQGQPYDDFVAKYTEKYGEAPISGFHAHAYDGANMIFAAIEKVAVQNTDGSLSIGRQALRDAMYGTKDFEGLTGKLTCDANGDCATGEALAVFQLTEAEVVDGAWPPQVYWQPGGGAAPAAAAPAAGQTIPAGSFTCEDAIGCVDIVAGDPLHIAWIATVSGGTAPLGTDNNRGVEIAIDDKGGELLGHPIELTGEDSLCSAEGGQTAGTKIASDPTVVGIIGTTCSSEARAAMPLIAEAGMVMISPSNTNPDLTNPEHPDHHPGYLRTAHNDLFQGRIAAEFAFNELGLKTAATIHDGSPYAESLQQVFADVFTELGGTITSQEAVNVGDTDMKGVLTKIGADKPEIIYFPIFEPEGDFIAAQKCDVPDLADTLMMGADGLTIDTFPEAAGECAIGMYLSGPYVQGQPYDDFVAKYEEKYGEKPVSGFHAHAYDGANMIFNAIEQVAVMEDDGTLHIPRQALRDAMYGIKDFEGLTGKLSCDEYGDCATGEALAVFQLTEAEVVDGAWPPKPFWLPGSGEAAAPAEGEAMEAMAPPECTELTPVNLQLQWVAQSQFAGYYAAKAQGFFEEFCLDVTILEGAVDIVPQQVVASGQAQFGIAWVPKVLASREEGADLVNIAQVFQRSGTLEVSWADNPVATVADMKGKKIGTWGFGNEHELFAAMRKEGIDPNNKDDVTVVQQSFDMLALLNRELDAAEAMTYNEYAQVLEAENPDTGELYQPEDLVVINFNDVGTAMLQDHVFVDGAWLAEEGNEQIATQFLAAAFKGWQFCRDSFDECVQIVLDNGPTLGQGHMTWQLNEINKLIWPSPNGIGIMDPALWEQTATISVEGGVIKEAPSDDAYRTDLAEAAHKYLSGDVTGESWTAQTVEVTPGGE